MKSSSLLIAVFGVFLTVSHAIAFESSVDGASVPPHKVTPVGLYLSSQDAHKALSRDPDILFIDVRDPDEISLAGHPVPVDAIVPVMRLTAEMDPETGSYIMSDNPDFLAAMTETIDRLAYDKSAPIIVTCGSGRRSAMAVRQLNMAGYSRVWHIVDGYPGDEQPGINIANAWEMAGLPWTTTAIVPGSAWDSLFPTN